MANYDQQFFDYVNAGALRSAQHLLPVLLKDLPVDSILDVGCGQGAWLSVWKQLGASTALGIDGTYVDTTRLLVPCESFFQLDLSTPFDLGRSFDLVQSLEVAEHLPSSCAAGFIQSLVRHSDFIFFSAAPKGQGGHNHVNEQDYEYWRSIFADHDYVPADFIRRKIISNSLIEPWYRYNPILYINSRQIKDLHPALRDFIVPKNVAIRDISPLLYKVRKLVVRALPVPAMTQLAELKERWSNSLAQIRFPT